jgi:D-sedoheptulose 7-phosphate isomerase
MENNILKDRLKEHIYIAQKILQDEKISAQIIEISKKIIQTYKKGGKIIFIGNGGSAADAQHMAAEFVGKYLKDRKALAAVALTTNTSILTAISNDYSYSDVFLRQVQALATKDDIIIGISTSGNSENVIKALSYAKENGIFSIGFSGEKKAKIDQVVDICVKVPSSSTPRIQEMHEFLLHTIAEIVEQELF